MCCVSFRIVRIAPFFPPFLFSNTSGSKNGDVRNMRGECCARMLNGLWFLLKIWIWKLKLLLKFGFDPPSGLINYVSNSYSVVSLTSSLYMPPILKENIKFIVTFIDDLVFSDRKIFIVMRFFYDLEVMFFFSPPPLLLPLPPPSPPSTKTKNGKFDSTWCASQRRKGLD